MRKLNVCTFFACDYDEKIAVWLHAPNGLLKFKLFSFNFIFIHPFHNSHLFWIEEKKKLRVEDKSFWLIAFD